MMPPVDADPLPRVRVVVLNYDGGDMTLRCVASVLRHPPITAQMEVVVVDNGSVDGLDLRLPEEYPKVKLIVSETNRGFAGGCNLGMEDLDAFDFVALLNNDAYVESNWLDPLVVALSNDAALGAACPKILFAERRVPIEIRSDVSLVGEDPRLLGIAITGVRRDDDDEPLASRQVGYDEGFWPAESGEHRWTNGAGTVLLPPHCANALVHLSLEAPVAGRSAELVSDVQRLDIELSGSVTVAEVKVGDACDVVNNAGSSYYRGGYGGDRGFLQVDRGRFDSPADVFAWCGGAVLLRASYLRSVGMFDERLFVYYEDTDLSWRGRHKGWSYRYVPESVVRHEHAATSGGSGSPVFRFHVSRNRVLVLAKNAPGRIAVRALGDLVSMARNDLKHGVWAQLVRRRRPHYDSTSARALWSAITLLPAALAERRRVRRRSCFLDDALAGWETEK
jgi:GT2 family glycosyltransferase